MVRVSPFTTARRLVAVPVLVVTTLVAALALSGAPASAAVSERHFVHVYSEGWILDHSVEIWNRDTGQRVWRSDGPQLSVFRPYFTYSYTYRGGNEYLRVQVRAKAGHSKDINFLDIRCDTYVDVFSARIRDHQQCR